MVAVHQQWGWDQVPILNAVPPPRELFIDRTHEKCGPRENGTEVDAKPPSDRPQCFSSTTAEVLFVITATMSVGMTSTLSGGLTVVTNKIGEDLNMTNAEVSWTTASTSLASGAFLLFFGRLADLFGRKPMFIGSLFFFAIFCLGAGFAQNGITFDVLAGCLGLFSASAVTPAIGSLGAVYEKPSKRKNYAFAAFSAGNPLGYVFGSIACGICTQILSWRAYLFLMAIIYAIVCAVAVFVMPADVDSSERKPFNWTTFKSFDIVGALLTISGFGLLSASLTLAGNAPQGWKTPYVIALLVVGIVLILVFLYWETTVDSPLLPMWVWKDRDFSLLLLILFIGFGTFMAASFWITLYIQRYRTSSSLLVAVYILPMAVMGTIVNVTAGLVLHRISSKLLMLIGTACFPVSFLLLGLNRDDSSYWYFMFWSFCICVWGADLQFNVANMYVMTALPSSQQSTGGSIFQTITRLSTAVFLGITTAIFNAVEQNPPTAGYLGHQNAAPYNATFYFCTIACALSLICIPFLKVGTQGGITKTVLDEESTSQGDTEKVQPVEDVAWDSRSTLHM